MKFDAKGILKSIDFRFGAEGTQIDIIFLEETRQKNMGVAVYLNDAEFIPFMRQLNDIFESNNLLQWIDDENYIGIDNVRELKITCFNTGRTFIVEER